MKHRNLLTHVSAASKHIDVCVSDGCVPVSCLDMTLTLQRVECVVPCGQPSAPITYTSRATVDGCKRFYLDARLTTHPGRYRATAYHNGVEVSTFPVEVGRQLVVSSTHSDAALCAAGACA